MLKFKIIQLVKDLTSLLYPSLCPGCKEALEMNEKIICTSCRIELPRTNFSPKASNQIEKHFWGKVNLEGALAFFQFHKGSEVMHLLHELKYKGNEEVGEVMGRMFASEYLDTDFFRTVDVIIPVPLHVTKQRVRGYNQCDSICKGISEITGILTEFHGLERTKANETQTSKGRFERYRNTKKLFVLNKKELAGKHVLIVDDVITTGSTLEACVHPLLDVGAKVSVVAMACPID